MLWALDCWSWVVRTLKCLVLKLDELGAVSYRILKLGEASFTKVKLGDVRFRISAWKFRCDLFRVKSPTNKKLFRVKNIFAFLKRPQKIPDFQALTVDFRDVINILYFLLFFRVVPNALLWWLKTPHKQIKKWNWTFLLQKTPLSTIHIPNFPFICLKLLFSLLLIF